jgi:hypothetical protein
VTTYPRLLLLIALACAPAPAFAEPALVNSDNFIRAESDLYFKGVVGLGGFGRLNHTREMTPLDRQTVIRLNRDTLYSSAVFDLDAGPVTITLPDAGDRFISLQVIDQDHYTHGVYYEPGPVTLERDAIGTRYVVTAIRILANPEDPGDLAKVHALQDAIGIEQARTGTFEPPAWDEATRSRTRKALNALGDLLPDTRRMFGSRREVDPIRHLIGSAMAWGGNPETEALYLNRVAPNNDGRAAYTLKVAEVPVRGFWSVSVYNADGYYTPNAYNAYTLNNLTAKTDADGGVTIRFGGCDGEIPNCLPTPDGWSWMVRLYRPDTAILDGSWIFPDVKEIVEELK